MSDASTTETTAPAPAPAPKPSRLKALGAALVPTFKPLTGFIQVVGDHMILLGQAVYWGFRRPFRARLFIESSEYVGVGSLPIITLVGAFTGAVTALQAVNAFRLLKAEGYSGSAVGLSLAV